MLRRGGGRKLRVFLVAMSVGSSHGYVFEKRSGIDVTLVTPYVYCGRMIEVM